MKNFVILLVCMLTISACNEGAFLVPIDNDGMAEVSFSIGGEYVSIDEEPLTRAISPNAKTFYAFRIFETDTISKGTRYQEIINMPYTNGLFDDITKLRVALAIGKTYVIEALIIEEREDTIFHRDGFYSSPFKNGGLFDYNYKDGAVVTNRFSSDEVVTLTDGRYIEGGINWGYQMARVDRYCGSKRIELSSNSKIEIDMKRYAFAFTYNITPPIDGVIRVKLPKFGGRVIYEVKAGDSPKTERIIYNAPFEYYNIIDGMIPKEQTIDLDVVIEWERGSEDLESYTEEKVITIKRNTNYKMNINMNGRDGESILNIDCKEEFVDESIIIN